MKAISAVRVSALALTVITGFTALVYEVTWQYYLANLLGSQARSAALIVATFLGGLAAGYALFGRCSAGRSPRQSVMGCALLEGLIGAWALLFPLLERVLWRLHFEHHSFEGSLFADIVIAVLLIGAPTVMMGASLPLLTHGLSLGVEDAAPFHAKIYIVNTLGAFLGALFGGFVLIPSLGLERTMLVMGALNLGAGACFGALGSFLGSEGRAQPGAEGADGSGEPLSRQRIAALAGFACAGGFISITLQTVLLRITALALGASVYTFAMVLSAFILVLALGAWVIAERSGGRVSLAANQAGIVAGLIGIYLAAPFLPYGSHMLRTLFTSVGPSFWLYNAAAFVALCLLILLPVGCIGAMLPILFRESRDRRESLGRRVGLVYGANTAGCVVGAILGGYLSLYVLNLAEVLLGCVVAAGLVLLAIAWREPGRGFSAMRASAVAAAFFPLVAMPWPEYAFARGTFRLTKALDESYSGFAAFYGTFMGSQDILAYKDDPNTTVAVMESSDGSRSILVNGKSDGSTRSGDRITTKLMAHLPGLLQSSSSRRAAVVGFGTGITVGSLAKYDEVDRIDILEISPAVRRFSPLFDGENSGASRSPKISWHLGDAYRFLLESRDGYAIIASEPSNPWVGGVERLYSKEFFDIARDKLAPGGIYAQWFHTYSISQDTMALVLKTFHASFPNVHLFERDSDVVLIGSKEPLDAQSLKRMRERFGRDAIRDDLSDVGVSAPKDLLAREVPMPWEGLGGAPLQTLGHPTLSYRAGRDFFSEASVDAARFSMLPEHRGYSRRAFPRTLMGIAYGSEAEADKLRSLALLHCSAGNTSADSSWSQQTQLCRQALVAMVVRGEIPPNKTVTQPVKDLFLSLAPGSSQAVVPAVGVEEASLGLDWIAEYGAPLLALDAARIRAYAAPCFRDMRAESADCRGRLVMTLAASGFFPEAREEFLRIQSDRLPLRDLSQAQMLARVAGVAFSADEQRKLALLN